MLNPGVSGCALIRALRSALVLGLLASDVSDSRALAAESTDAIATTANSDASLEGIVAAGRLADLRAPAWVFLTGMKLDLSSTDLRNLDGSWRTR